MKNDKTAFNLNEIREQASKICKEFISLCLTTKAALQCELDDDIIMSFNKVLAKYINSKDFDNDFNKGYRQAMERYGSVEATMYNLIISMLRHGPQNKTTQDMLRQANARLNHLGGKEFNKQNQDQLGICGIADEAVHQPGGVDYALSVLRAASKGEKVGNIDEGYWYTALVNYAKETKDSELIDRIASTGILNASRELGRKIKAFDSYARADGSINIPPETTDNPIGIMSIITTVVIIMGLILLLVVFSA